MAVGFLFGVEMKLYYNKTAENGLKARNLYKAHRRNHPIIDCAKNLKMVSC